MNKIVYPLVVVVAVLSIFGNILAFYRYSSSRPLLTVNGVPITRKQFNDRVDYLYARPLLASMIWQSIVLQAAKQNNCVPTDDQVNAAVQQLERSNPSVVENARHTDPNLLIFKEDLQSNLALRNLRMVGISASPAEIQAFYNSHKYQFQLPKQTQTTLVIANNPVDAATASRLLQNDVDPSVIAQQRGLGVVGMNVRLAQALPSYVGQDVLNMSSGDVKIIPVGSVFAIVKVKAVSEQSIPPLSAIIDQVRTACILAKAPTEVDVLKQLRSKASITANVEKYAYVIPDDPSQSADPGIAPSQQ